MFNFQFDNNAIRYILYKHVVEYEMFLFLYNGLSTYGRTIQY